MRNLAIVSPQRAAYSETFINAHKSIEDYHVHFYHSGDLPTALDDKALIASRSFGDRLKYGVMKRLDKKTPDLGAHLLSESFKEHKIDCVLAEYGTAGAEVLPICRNLKIPLVVHFHGFDATHHGVLKKLRTSYFEMFAYAQGVIAVSKKMIEDLVALGCPREKIHYNVYGPDPSFVKIEPSFEAPTLVGLGRFVDKKAPYYTILAFYKALKSHPEAKLIIGGDGPLLNTCENLVRYLGIEESVLLPGVLTRAEFQSYLSTCRAYVQHSIAARSGDCEGTPVSIIEASAAGLPVISTYHAGIPDVIIHGQTGLLSAEHDVDSMAIHFEEALADKQVCVALGAKGKQRIIENFTLNMHLDKLRRILEGCSV